MPLVIGTIHADIKVFLLKSNPDAFLMNYVGLSTNIYPYLKFTYNLKITILLQVETVFIYDLQVTRDTQVTDIKNCVLQSPLRDHVSWGIKSQIGFWLIFLCLSMLPHVKYDFFNSLNIMRTLTKKMLLKFANLKRGTF